MRIGRVLHVGMVWVAMVQVLAVSQAELGAFQATDDDLGGVVTSSRGPEAGVWVIAETTDLQTRFVKTVVTDDQGRYLMPDLPQRSNE